MLGFLAAMCFVGPRAASARQAARISANELVSRAVQQQLANNGAKAHLMYRLHRVTPDRDELREILEIDDGSVARVIALKGQPLTSDQQKAEEQRLNHYLKDPAAWQQRRNRQREDEQRSDRLLAAFPRAFLYSYAGEEPGANGGSLLRLSFNPNPAYVAPNRDLRVLEGMQGTMWVDPSVNRIVRLQAKLIRDVEFGWGILGRLNSGGSFEIEQRDVGEGRWELVETKLNFEGKELMFKALHIHETENLSDFHPVHGHITLAQGIHMLEEYNPSTDQIAQQQSNHPAIGASTPPK